MSGLDLDMVDIARFVAPAQTSATIQATSVGDTYMIGAFATSIATYQPEFGTTQKTFVDLNGGSLVVGDIIEYTIVATNTGNDTALKVVVRDALPAGSPTCRTASTWCKEAMSAARATRPTSIRQSTTPTPGRSWFASGKAPMAPTGARCRRMTPRRSPSALRFMPPPSPHFQSGHRDRERSQGEPGDQIMSSGNGAGAPGTPDHVRLRRLRHRRRMRAPRQARFARPFPTPTCVCNVIVDADCGSLTSAKFAWLRPRPAATGAEARGSGCPRAKRAPRRQRPSGPASRPETAVFLMAFLTDGASLSDAS